MDSLLITRTFDVPNRDVFEAWVQPTQLARWFAPPGFVLHDCTMDLVPGGLFHYGMRAPNGAEMWGKWIFAAVDPPRRLVCTVLFSDEARGDLRHPWQPGWPMRTLSTLTLEERDADTALTLEWAPQDATEAEQQLFAESLAGMRQVWDGTLDQLAVHLASKRRHEGDGHAV